MPPDLSSQAAPSATVLFVDDDPDILATAELFLGRRGYRLLPARSPAEARSHLASEAIDVILLDLNFSPRAVDGEEGLDLLQEILRHDPRSAVVVVTGHSGVNVAVSAMRAGAKDFVMKPWSNSRLLVAVEDALRQRRAAAPQDAPDAEVPAQPDEPGLILGSSPAMQRVRDLIARAAATPVASVLIHGEAGSGKSLIARAIHRQSARGPDAFVALDLADAPTAALDAARFVGSDLTAAFEAARGGDLVLDEIGDLSPALQSRLAAFLSRQAGQGKTGEVRLIATSTRSREVLEQDARLRPDLLYALSTLEISLPALRERREDIPLLAEHFLRLYAYRYARPVRSLSPDAARRLMASAWPGNVRALRQAIERGVILSDGDEVALEGLQLGGGAGGAPPPSSSTLAASERALVEAALKRHSFNVSRAAQDLGLTRAALYRRMAKHGL